MLVVTHITLINYSRFNDINACGNVVMSPVIDWQTLCFLALVWCQVNATSTETLQTSASQEHQMPAASHCAMLTHTTSIRLTQLTWIDLYSSIYDKFVSIF